MKRLIFDLRGNTGGFLDQAHMIANEFLPENSLIVYTEGKAKKRQEFFSDGKGRLKDIPLAILIDEGSASASEIVAGAIQDNDRGTVVGRRSFGKGLVQEQIPFIDGSAIRLTVSRYYTPLGRSIQKPYDKGIDAYNNELEVRYNHNEFFTADSIKFNDSLKFVTPKGKIVYGGGGIMPDIFVAADTSGFNSFVQNLIRRNVILKFSLAYSDKHREELNKIDTFNKLNNYFNKKSSITNDFLAYAAKEGITPKAGELTESKELIDTYIKAYIGRNTPLEDNAFYILISPSDIVIKKTVNIFK